MAGQVVPSADDTFDASILPVSEQGDIEPSVGLSGNSTGGAVKASSVLGSIAGIAGGAGALSGVAAPIALPIAAVASIGSAIARLFGGGLDVPGSGFTQGEMEMLAHIKMRHDARVAKVSASSQ